MAVLEAVDARSTNQDGRGWQRPLIIAGCCYIAARLAIIATVDVATVKDTAGYVEVDLIGGGMRPWLYPTFRKLFVTDQIVVLAQTALSAIAFMLLALAIAGRLRTVPARVVVLAVIPLLGITQRITTWDAVITTESLAVTLTALGIAAALWWRLAPGWALVALFVAWTFLRDAHVMLAIPVAGVVASVMWRHQRRAVAVAFVVVALWGFVAANNNREIEAYNVTANIAWRVTEPTVGVADRIDWFTAHGMPESSALYLTEHPIYRLRGLEADRQFQKWAAGDGLNVYARYLIEHPAVTLRALPAIAVDYDLGPESMVDQGKHAPTATPLEPFNVVWPKTAAMFTAGLAGSAMLAALTLARSGRQRDLVVPVALTSSTIPHAFLVYHGAPMELARHGLVLSFVLVVGCWHLIALALDQIVIPHFVASSASIAATSPEVNSA